jgi:CheY-like chemotaxis protein
MLCRVMCHVLLQTCRRIRAAMAGSGLHIPIVMLTAQVGSDCSMHAQTTAAAAQLRLQSCRLKT